jgi:predicted flap endonuclease-1-like 5' DNA nuclease
MADISAIEGIGPAFEAKLDAAGVKSVEELLEVGATSAGREELEGKTGIDSKKLLEWVNRADLMRIKGVGGQLSDLLEASGVDSVPELAQRNAENLHAKMSEINEAKNLVNRLPSVNEVEDWVAEAKSLPKIVN